MNGRYFTPEKRSQVMARIRSRDTNPEPAVRSMLHQFGYRFTVNGPKNRPLPGHSLTKRVNWDIP